MRPISRVIMCPPDFFAIESAQNPFMEQEGELQKIDSEAAYKQWQALVDVLLGLDVEVDLLAPTPGLADQVFTANPAFIYPKGKGHQFLRANMRFESREDEVDALAGALRRDGIAETQLLGHAYFEGGGDLLWHNGRIWMGHGHRTDGSMLGAIRQATQVRVTPLRLVSPEFYHLDTALCILDDKAALWVPEAFDEDGRAELQEAFDLLIDVTPEAKLMAANAFSVDGEHIVIDGACVQTIEQLAHAGYVPVPVDTSEFRKSGGSVYCMKQSYP